MQTEDLDRRSVKPVSWRRPEHVLFARFTLIGVGYAGTPLATCLTLAASLVQFAVQKFGP
eukprot:5729194-Prymnesium_polylepis.3